MKTIRPLFPLAYLLVAAAFFVVAIMFWFSPIRDTMMLVGSILLGSVGITILWFIDRVFLRIERTGDVIRCKGFFSIRRFQLKINEIDGYEILQKVDRFHGLHEELQLVIKKKGRLNFRRVAYDNFDDLKALCEPELKFPGYLQLKNGKFLGRIIPLIFFISGILACLVGLVKLLRW